MTDIRDLHVGWMQDPSYRAEYDALEGEFALAAALIRVRADAGLTQEQLAERMGTKQGDYCPLGRRQGDAVNPDPDAVGEGDGDDFADQLRAGPGEGGVGWVSSRATHRCKLRRWVARELTHPTLRWERNGHLFGRLV